MIENFGGFQNNESKSQKILRSFKGNKTINLSYEDLTT